MVAEKLESVNNCESYGRSKFVLVRRLSKLLLRGFCAKFFYYYYKL
jgi:hypothetical protein